MEGSMPGENKLQTGGRVLKEGPARRKPNPSDTGDRGDEPEKPYELTRRVDETEAKTRTSTAFSRSAI
jgi:hypothetical protein